MSFIKYGYTNLGYFNHKSNTTAIKPENKYTFLSGFSVLRNNNDSSNRCLRINAIISQNLENKFISSGFVAPNRCLRINASIGGPSRGSNVHIINGNKVNGIYVDGGSSYKAETAVLEDDEPNHEYLLGRFVENRFVYRQSFIIRSYEIGPDKTATMETIMNLLQETALNHVANSGVCGNGFGATREMSIQKLIWVVTRIHIQVDKYSSWGDVVEIDTWVTAAGKYGMRRDWIIRDHNTRKIITRATSTWVIMNKQTRTLSKIPDEVREEVEPFYLINRVAISTQQTDHDKIHKLTHDTAQTIRSGLAPRWSDMDANQHVNNVKYIGWILELVQSTPFNHMETLLSLKTIGIAYHNISGLKPPAFVSKAIARVEELQ